MPLTNTPGQLAAVYNLTNNVPMNIPYPTMDPSLLDSVVLFNYSPFICEVKTGIADGYISPWTVDKFRTGSQNQVTVTPQGTIGGATKAAPIISNQMLALFVGVDEAAIHSGNYSYPQSLLAPDQIAQAIVAQQSAGNSTQTPMAIGGSHGIVSPGFIWHDQSALIDLNNAPTVTFAIFDSFVNGDGAKCHRWDFFWSADGSTFLSVEEFQLNAGVAVYITLPARARFCTVQPQTGGATTESEVSAIVSTFVQPYRVREGVGSNGFEHGSTLPAQGLMMHLVPTLVGANAKTAVFRLPLTSGRINISGTLNSTETGYLIYGFGVDEAEYTLVPMKPNCQFELPAPRAPMWVQFYAGNGTAMTAICRIDNGDT